MGDHAEDRRPVGIDTGPQGTRVFRREDIDRYVARRRTPSSDLHSGPSGAALVGANGAFKDRRFEIPAGRSTVGRSNTNTIVIDADSVSLVHARIIEKDGEWWVLNLLSTNGTYVNDRKVTDSRLHDGDRISFGDTEFVFRNAKPAKPMGLGWIAKLPEKIRVLFGRRPKA